jgi:hypothetical protein
MHIFSISCFSSSSTMSMKLCNNVNAMYEIQKRDVPPIFFKNNFKFDQIYQHITDIYDI